MRRLRSERGMPVESPAKLGSSHSLSAGEADLYLVSDTTWPLVVGNVDGGFLISSTVAVRLRVRRCAADCISKMSSRSGPEYSWAEEGERGGIELSQVEKGKKALLLATSSGSCDRDINSTLSPRS
jgi:hypothetical protein